MNTPVRHYRTVAVFLGLIGSLLWIVGFASDELPVCQLIATGGTIAMKIDPVKNAPVPALSGEDLVASVPELAKVARIRVESLSVANCGSRSHG
jgi:L-asparaginase/Glu-tRNA(Gln) amidotransferase subunit D